MLVLNWRAAVGRIRRLWSSVRGRVIVGVKVNGDGDDAGRTFAGCASLAWDSLQGRLVWV